MTTTKRINVTTTAYQGDAPFPEAAHYSDYVAEQLTERYGAEVDCSVGLSTQVFLYGFDEADRDLEYEIASLVKVDLWDDFCAEGYKSVQS